MQERILFTSNNIGQLSAPTQTPAPSPVNDVVVNITDQWLETPI